MAIVMVEEHEVEFKDDTGEITKLVIDGERLYDKYANLYTSVWMIKAWEMIKRYRMEEDAEPYSFIKWLEEYSK